MKKKLLFIMPSLCSGGAEKSLVNLLSVIDSDRYDVDLFLFRREGVFLPSVPDFVNVTDAGKDYLMFDGDFKSAVIWFLKTGKPSKALARLCYSRALKIKDESKRCRILWKYLKTVLPENKTVYDASIGYLESTSVYYCVEKTTATKHIGWLHTDYGRIEYQKETDEPHFKQLDALACVSAECRNIVEKYFPFLKGKTEVIENIISPGLISEMSRKADAFDKKDGETVILTVGRMSPPKGIDNAVKACALLLKRGYDIKWYHIGKGELLGETEDLIKSLGVSDRFILLGEKSNPYPYIDKCDIYVQPSRFEGKSIAIDEAKCLKKPIVSTCFTTVRDQIEDGVTGLICDISPEGIADKTELLLKDVSLRKKLSDNLSEEKQGNEEEALKLYKLIEE
ncbi:MAG: glycosyltransferase [Clostridiales bacterium]|nr:glycosyltransferase [Clostridiales bacterium]